MFAAELSMATAETGDEDDLNSQRSHSPDGNRPNFSELRIVLLGNSWAERSSVGNFILGKTVYKPDEQVQCCLPAKEKLKEKEILFINTPDLLHPDISEDKLRQLKDHCVMLSDPGPHLFLLVLQPEEFTEQHKLRLEFFLKLFSDRSFHHSLVLISTFREKSSGLVGKYLQHPLIGQMIRKCNKWLLWQKNVRHLELFTMMDLIVKENDGNHVKPMDATFYSQKTYESLKQGEVGNAGWYPVLGLKSIMDSAKGIMGWAKPTYTPVGSTVNQLPLRIVLLGKSENKKSRLSHFITGDGGLHGQKLIKRCIASCGEWRGRSVTVVRTPDIFSWPEQTVRAEMKRCTNLCFPGPNVLLLLVKPSEFNTSNKTK
ncbi:hypothetical protein AALO_G00087490, partial [Alosa alosa]